MQELYLATRDLRSFSPKMLFSELKAHEFDLNRMSSVKDDEEVNQAKEITLKATTEKSSRLAFYVSNMTREELEEHTLILAKELNKMNSKN